MIGMAVLARPRFGPVFSMLPNWLISGALGAWMGVLMVLFSYGVVAQFTATYLPVSLQSPWLLVVETGVLGIIIGWASAHVFSKTPLDSATN